MRSLRITHGDIRSWPPFIVVMFPRQQSCWRSGKIKIVVLLLVSLLAMQYFVGSSVYNIRIFDTRLFYDNKWLHLDRNRNDGTAPQTEAMKQPENENTTSLPVKKVPVATPGADAVAEAEPSPESVAANLTSSLSSQELTVSSLMPDVATSNFTATPGPATLPFNGSSSNVSVSFANEVLTTESTQNDNNIQSLKPAADGLPLCPMLPPVLVGPIRVWFDKPTFEELKKLHPYLEPGGHSKPEKCTSRHRVAIIIPYRDREDQLRVFLHNMLDLLHKQQLDFAVYIIEQIRNQTFNRAKLMNIGFKEASKFYDWQCFIYHDVDLLPEDDRNIYSCPEQPRHMSVAVDKFDYKLPYSDIFGGITALTKDQFQKVNGFSNDFWGWGGEDDEMASRVMRHFKVSRYKPEVARYKMMKHVHEESNPVNKCRYSLMYKYKTRMYKDGLSSLNYKVVKRELLHTHTLIKVDLLEAEERKRLDSEHIC